jgi:hypothetical protein
VGSLGILRLGPADSAGGVRAEWRILVDRRSGTGKVDHPHEEPPPQLRRLAWQDQFEACSGESWLPSGELDRSNDWMPPITSVDIDQTESAREKPRFVSLWISHPLFDAQSLVEIKLLDAGGKEPLKTPTGSFGFQPIPASPDNADTGWITATLCAGKKGAVPPKATVLLRYGVGPWRFLNEIASDFKGTMMLGNGVMLGTPGQDADGHAFIQVTHDSNPESVAEQFGFAAITKDGRLLVTTGYGKSSVGKVVSERFSFNTPLAQVKSFECRKRPIQQIQWPVVLRDLSNPSGQVKIELDRAGYTMGNIIHHFRTKHDVRIAFEDLDFDAQKDTITLGQRIATLEGKQRAGRLTARENESLHYARRLRNEAELADDSVIDVGIKYEGVIKSDSVEDFLNQLTGETPYDWTSTDGGGTWVVLPRAGSRLKYPVELNTAGLTVEEAVAKIIEQRPEGSEIGMGQVFSGPVVPGTDPTPWLHVKCKPSVFHGMPAWRALSLIGETAKPDSVWQLAGYKEHRMLSISRGTGLGNVIVDEAQAWLVKLDCGNYAGTWKEASAYFKASVTDTDWILGTNASRKPFGEVKSRKLVEVTAARSLPGAPDGLYFVMQFETSFAAKEKAVETVTFMKETDDSWKAAAYFIR